jgi:hypothetical protein
MHNQQRQMQLLRLWYTKLGETIVGPEFWDASLYLQMQPDTTLAVSCMFRRRSGHRLTAIGHLNHEGQETGGGFVSDEMNPAFEW